MNFSPSIHWDMRTPDLAAVRRTISRVLKPYSLETGETALIDAQVLHRRLRNADFAVVDYGRAVTIDAGQMMNFYLIQVPLAGSYRLCTDGSSTQVNCGDVHLIHPRVPLRMEWSEDCRLLVVRTSDQRLAQIEQHQRNGDAHELGYILSSTARGVSLTRALDYLTTELTLGELIASRREFASVAESLLLEALLEAAADLAPSALRACANPVQLAHLYIRDNLRAEISSADIVAASGTSRRKLFEAFSRVFGEGPMSQVRRLRLARVRDSLSCAAEQPRDISDIATEWGFTHFGHFCAGYRRLFHETPSDTRRRAFRAGLHLDRNQGDSAKK